MARLINVLSVIAQVVIALAVTFELLKDASLPGFVAIGAGVAVFLFLAQLHSTINNFRNRRALTAQIEDMTVHVESLEQSLEKAEAELAGMSQKFDVETRERNDKLVSEMRVIETLVKRLAEAGGALRAPAGRRTEDGKQLAAKAGHPPLPLSSDDLENMDDAELLEIIRHSLEDNRVDLYLQPIVTLPQRKVRFYEALTRLRAPTGEVILPQDYMRVAESAGMMPTVDNLLLFRCIQVVRKLSQNNRDIGLFCNISANSLLDEDFFPQFVEYMEFNKDLASQLVFEFSQATVNGCGPIENESLAALAGLGFKFSMDRVTSLKLDYAKLHETSFRYIKIPAQTLLSGLAGTDADIHPGDLKELMSRHGINLIIDKIESERQVIDILDYGVDYGQGYLFGKPRPVKGEVVRTNRTVNAA